VDYAKLPRILLPELHPIPANGLAKTPPMGWNSWNKFQTHIDDAIVRGIADAIVSNGMKDVGYEYVIIDDGWQGKRDANGVLSPNRNFPDMKALADYVHSKGLKIGIYSSPGPRTCGGFEGSYGHEDQDAKTFAAWGMDYLKYDWCSASRIWKR
jgi:alpha-galactosidase